MTPSGIDPATFRFVAQCLNHCATACPHTIIHSIKIYKFLPSNVQDFFSHAMQGNKTANRLLISVSDWLKELLNYGISTIIFIITTLYFKTITQDIISEQLRYKITTVEKSSQSMQPKAGSSEIVSCLLVSKRNLAIVKIIQARSEFRRGVCYGTLFSATYWKKRKNLPVMLQNRFYVVRTVHFGMKL
jgi:hypothetical protein